MLAYAFYIAFVGGFVAIAALGHVLLLSALLPDILGDDKVETGADGPAHPVPEARKLAA